MVGLGSEYLVWTSRSSGFTWVTFQVALEGGKAGGKGAKKKKGGIWTQPVPTVSLYSSWLCKSGITPALSMVSSLGGAPKMLIFVECEDAWGSAWWGNWGPRNGMCWGWGEGRPLPLITWEEDAEEPSGQALPGYPFLPHLSEYMLPFKNYLRLLRHSKTTDFAQSAFLCSTFGNVFRANLQHTQMHTHTHICTQKSKIICHFLRKSPSRIVFFLSENSTIQVDRWWFWSSGELNSRFWGPAGLGSQSSIDQSLCLCVKALLFENLVQISKNDLSHFSYIKKKVWGCSEDPLERSLIPREQGQRASCEARSTHWDVPVLLSLKKRNQ